MCQDYCVRAGPDPGRGQGDIHAPVRAGRTFQVCKKNAYIVTYLLYKPGQDFMNIQYMFFIFYFQVGIVFTYSG